MRTEKEFMYDNLHMYKEPNTVPVYTVYDRRNSQVFINTFSWDMAWDKCVKMKDTHYPHISMLEVEV